MTRLLEGVFASGGSSEYNIAGSTRFNAFAPQYLSRSYMMGANKYKFTVAAWIKSGNKADTTDYAFIISSRDFNSTFFIDPNGYLAYVDYRAATYPIDVRSDIRLRDSSGWRHVMLVVDTTLSTSSERVKFYINGERVTVFSGTPTYPPQYYPCSLPSDKELAIGYSIWGALGYDGFMSDFYYADGLNLGPSDFVETGLFNEKIPKQYSGSLGKNGFYLPLREPSNVNAIGKDYSETVGGDPLFDSTFAQITTSSTTGHTNSTITDSSANNLTMSYSGAIAQGGDSPFRRRMSQAWNQITDGQSLYFRGAYGSDVLNSAASNGLNFGTGDFSVECWVKGTILTADNFYNRIWMQDGPAGNSGNNLQLSLDPTTGGVYLWNGVSQIGTTSSTSLVDGSWHHVAITRASGTLRCFVDGIAMFTVTDNTNYAPATNCAFRIGAFSTTSGRWNGLISNLRVVKGSAVYTSNFSVPTEPLTAISGTQLLLKGSSLNAWDATGKAPVFLVGSASVTTADKKTGTTSISVPTNSYILMNNYPLNSIGTKDFCVEGWFKMSSTASIFVWGCSNGGGAIPKLGVYTNASSQVQVDMNGTAVVTSSSAISANTWFHLAIVRYRGVLNVYYDGYSIGSVSNTTSITGLNAPFHAGWFGEGSVNFNGYIDNFRVTVGDARYYSNFEPTTSEFETYGPGVVFNDVDMALSAYANSIQHQGNLYGGFPSLTATNTIGSSTDGTANADPYAQYQVLNVPMNGTNGAQAFTDIMPTGRTSSQKTINVTSVSPTTSTSFSKYYGSSGTFSGTDNKNLSVNASTDFQFSTTTNFTFELWFYPTSFTGTALFRRLFAVGQNLTNDYSVNLDGSGIPVYRNNDNVLITSSAASNLNAWNHFALSKEGSTTRMFLNGSLVGSTTTNNNLTTAGQYPLYIGNHPLGTAPFSGYMQDFRVYKGISKYNRAFNPIPSPVVQRYHAFSYESPSTYTSTSGEAFGNYCTLNAQNITSGVSLGAGGMSALTTGSNTGTWSTMAVSSGKWYWEVTKIYGDLAVFLSQDPRIDSYQPGYGDTTSLAIYMYYSSGGTSANRFAWGSTGQNVTAMSGDFGDDIAEVSYGFLLDLDNKVLKIRRGNATEQTYSIPASIYAKPLYIGYKVTTTWPAAGFAYNFGQIPFTYDLPSGYKAICTANFETPSISNPTTEFNTVLYTANNGGSQSISSLSFSPDLVWLKNRTGASGYHGALFDTTRGALRSLSTSRVDLAEQVETTGMVSFDSNGFSLNGAGLFYVNNSNDTMVGWCWDEDPSAGFDIVSYTGNGTNNQTLSHNLGGVPDMITIRNRDQANSNWIVEHVGLANGTVLLWNSEQAQSGVFTTEYRFYNRTSTTFQVGSYGGGSNTNNNGQRYIAYLWRSIPGYSAFGTFIGNGSDNGAYVYTGFKPAFILIKSAGAAGGWNVIDNKRIGYNVKNYTLYTHLSTTEQGYQPLDITSNGFKLRSTNTGTNAFNSAGTTFIYMAFAEVPGKYALAR